MYLFYRQVLYELVVLVLILPVSWEDVNMELVYYFGARMRKTYVFVIYDAFCLFLSL